jgi:hypothetical protein
MPKIEIITKYVKDDIVYLIYLNGIVRGKVHSANVYSIFGRDDDPRCIHQKAEDAWVVIGDEEPNISEPMIEYYIEIDHPVAHEQSPYKPVLERVIGSGRLFRSPETLVEYLKRKFLKAYGEKVPDLKNDIQ